MNADYSFKPGWAAAFAVAVLVPTFLALGNWQLDRAAAKEALLSLRDERLRGDAWVIDAAAPPLDQIRYRSVVVRGTYDVEHQFLLDNQIYQGQAGYHVLTPLKLDGQADRAILVNRGWVAVGPDRARLPPVGVAPEGVTLHGIADKFTEVAWHLSGAEVPAPGWPAVTLVAEPAALSERLGYSILPYQVLLLAAEPQGYVRDWKPASVDPGKNRGYALQWFAFAGVLTALFVWHGLRRNSGRSDREAA
jgi:surfeit locus 1 family protein